MWFTLPLHFRSGPLILFAFLPPAFPSFFCNGILANAFGLFLAVLFLCLLLPFFLACTIMHPMRGHQDSPECTPRSCIELRCLLIFMGKREVPRVSSYSRDHSSPLKVPIRLSLP
eukprot:RCo035514